MDPAGNQGLPGGVGREAGDQEMEVHLSADLGSDETRRLASASGLAPKKRAGAGRVSVIRTVGLQCRVLRLKMRQQDHLADLFTHTMLPPSTRPPTS